MIKKIFLLLSAFFITGLSMAYGQPQEAKPPELHSKKSRNTLGLSFGLHHSQSQDLVYSPLIYDGQSLLALDLFYQRRSQKGLHLIKIAVDQVSVEATEALAFPFFGSTITRQSNTASSFELQYGYAREILQKEKLRLLLGGMLDNQIHAVEYTFAESDDIAYLISYALAVWLHGEYRLNQTQQLNFATSFPLIYFLSRPPYAIVDNEGIQSSNDFSQVHKRGQFKVLNGFVKLSLLLSYVRELSSKIDLLLSYQFEYLTASEPLKMSVVRNGFDVGLAFKF